MGLTSLSVLLAVILLNIHLYGSALKPVPHRLRRLLFLHIAPFLHVRLHRATANNDRKQTRRSSTISQHRLTTIYNAIFLNEHDLLDSVQRLSTNAFLHSTATTIDDHRSSISPTSINNTESASQSLHECKRLLTELNRLMFSANESKDDDAIIRDWQNVAVVMDRCLFYTYLISTTTLTVVTLLLAPLFKTIPTPPEYFRLNITRE
jgi:hypothetical protein